MTYSQTFTADHDPSKRNYDVHFVVELDYDEANDETISSADLLKSVEALLVNEHGFTPIAAKCASNDGQFTSHIWIDEDPVPLVELIDAYRSRERFLDREDRVELYQRPDMKWDWRVLANNDNLIATSGNQGYENRGDAAVMVYSLFGPLQISVVPFNKAPLYAVWNGVGTLVVEEQG